MALTAMLGLTGLPMAIGSLAVAASAPMNFIFFKRLKICSKKDTIAVTIEPLTQADVVSANQFNLCNKLRWRCTCWYYYISVPAR